MAEKRRVAPGWLDVGEEGRMLVPERRLEASSASDSLPDDRNIPLMGSPADFAAQDQRLTANDEGAALDRAFGGMRF